MRITNINRQKIIDLAVHPVNNNDKMNAFNSLSDAHIYTYIIYISNGLCLSTLPQRVPNTHMRGLL